MNVSVVGLGYVGLPVALLAAKKGYKTYGIDIDQDKIDKINKSIDPLGDHYVARHIKKTTLTAGTDFQKVADSQVIVICVPTPVKNDYQPDLRPLKNAAAAVAKHIRSGSLIIIESTINPGVCDEVLVPLIQKESGLSLNHDFYLSHCPERINPGDKKWTVENIPRVAGSSNPEGLRQTVKFYESIIDAPIKAMVSLKEAESVKIVENSFRDINIAFVNELARSFTKLGVNVNNVIDGAATKPFAFLPHYPGIGVGGHCIPVDPYYLIEYAKGYGFDHEFLSLARSINNRMPEFAAERLIEGFAEAGISIKGAKVAVLGLAYKPDVADDRESPSYKLIDILRSKGADVTCYDPCLPAKSTAKDLKQALAGRQAIVLATAHSVFKDINPGELSAKVFVDGQNSFSRAGFEQAGIIYKGIGS